MNRRLGVLISGRGSNLQSIIDAIARGALDATVAVVISNRSDAAGLARARDAGIDTMTVLPRDHRTREAYDQALAQALKTHDVGLVCLAGFMRLVGAPLLEAFPDRILNIHPSLLPSFPGLDAQAQAIAHGVRVSGATVHFVTAGLDDGPIVAASGRCRLPTMTRRRRWRRERWSKSTGSIRRRSRWCSRAAGESKAAGSSDPGWRRQQSAGAV